MSTELPVMRERLSSIKSMLARLKEDTVLTKIWSFGSTRS
jgi:hypothetical protein